MQFSLVKIFAITSAFGLAIANPVPEQEASFRDVAKSLNLVPEGAVSFTDDGYVNSLDGSGAVIDKAQLTESQYAAYTADLAKRAAEPILDVGTSPNDRNAVRQIGVCRANRCYSNADCPISVNGPCYYCNTGYPAWVCK